MRNSLTPDAIRLLESLHPADQAIVIRCASDLAPLHASAVDALSRAASSNVRWATLLTKEQKREYQNWTRRDRRRRAKHLARLKKGGA